MATAAPRRTPVQARSRQTVHRILDAAAELVATEGVDAASTRAVADRAGVSYPSLYRFFADREDLLDELVRRHLAELDEVSVQAEQAWTGPSAAELFDAELDAHVDYYRAHPSAARLWMGGRTSPAVTAQVHARMQALATRLHARLVEAGALPPQVDATVVLVVVELGDRVLELAYRERDDFDPTLLAVGRGLLRLAVETSLRSSG